MGRKKPSAHRRYRRNRPSIYRSRRKPSGVTLLENAVRPDAGRCLPNPFWPVIARRSAGHKLTPMV